LIIDLQALGLFRLYKSTHRHIHLHFGIDCRVPDFSP
jgi:hypothetical protein